MNNNLTPAATVLVLRDFKDEMEVLMLKDLRSLHLVIFMFFLGEK